MINHLTSEDVAALGLTDLEYRYYGTTDDDTDYGDDNGDGSYSPCDLWTVTVYADGTTQEHPHCNESAVEDGDGDLEGIGGTYKTGGTFSYIEDNHELCDRYDAMIGAKIAAQQVAVREQIGERIAVAWPNITA